MSNNSRLVYSTDAGQTCGTCGKPHRACTCGTAADREQPVPDRPVAKLRLEKAGRGGKSVTVIYGLPRNQAFLKELSGELKRAFGVGGAVRDDVVELQGDLRDRLRGLLSRKGFVVKG